MTKRLSQLTRLRGARGDLPASDHEGLPCRRKPSFGSSNTTHTRSVRVEDEEEEVRVFAYPSDAAEGTNADYNRDNHADHATDTDVEGVRAALATVFFSLLPGAMRRLTGGGSRGGVFLFNNHYVVKSGCKAAVTSNADADADVTATSADTADATTEAADITKANDTADDSFGWHTDAAEQLALCLTPAARAQDYVSFWCPLDACSEANGTLVVQPAFAPPPAVTTTTRSVSAAGWPTQSAGSADSFVPATGQPIRSMRPADLYSEARLFSVVGGDTGGEVGASEEKNGHRVDAADAEARRLGGLGVGLEAPPEALPEVTAPSGDNSDAARGGVTITARLKTSNLYKP